MPCRNYSGRPVFLAALSLYGLAIWPILHADRFYIDDLGRAYAGYLGWSSDGRPLANVVMELFNLGTPLTDLSPLPQVAALLLFAMLAVQVARRFGIGGTWRAPLIVAPLVAQPFFLENLSYKFDSLTMSLAVTLAALAVVGPVARGWRGVAGMACILASLCLYQPALNVFLVFALAELIHEQARCCAPRALLALAGVRILQLLVACGLYGGIMAATVKGHYATSHQQLPDVAQAWPVMLHNLAAFWRYVTAYTATSWAALPWMLTVAGVVLALGAAIRYAGTHWAASPPRVRLALALGPVAVVLGTAVLPWGPMLILRDPVFAPRVMVGVGALASAALLAVSCALTRWRVERRWHVAVLAAPAYGLFVFAAAYGNALGLQKAYEDRLTADIAQDLSGLADSAGVRRYTLRGHAPRPPVVQHDIRKYPLLDVLVPVYLTAGWGWAGDALRHAGSDLRFLASSDAGAPCAAVPAVRRQAYRIYTKEDMAIVVFPDAACRAG
ncbi:glucosyltransferase domain-containing protein [Bordetella flabilis]|uniref:Glucosyltransferase GtrII-like protein n=1 Tax=Bordetella flabilis TaxID=463014 RepID=A0A193GA33_9BORD|nr:glucosyltransferase domain-containing protein [Bordetella flabilis]ANN76852.1 hypothetical protein BAU07_06750 [Bordetella flabilis]